MTQFALDMWNRARTTLASAASLVERDPNSSAALAYYAAFYALSAAFALRDRSFSKHTEIRAALHRDLIRTGVIDAGMGQCYDFLFATREVGNYGGSLHVSLDDARKAIESSRDFLTAITRLCPQFLG